MAVRVVKYAGYRYRLNSNVDLTLNWQRITAPGGDASASAVQATAVRARIGF